MLNLTIWCIGRPLDKKLGLDGIRKKSRPKTAKQRQSEVKKQFERRKKRCAHRSSSRLEVAVLGLLRSHVYDVVSLLLTQAK